MKNFLHRSAVLVATVLASSQALAHGDGGHSHLLVDGFVHPVTGWDHALVALVVGLIAAQWQRNTGNHAWRLPALFIGGMAAGMAAGAMLPFGGQVESGIVLSLLAAGMLLMAPLQRAGRALTVSALAVAGFAGAAHGVVHGVEAGFQPLYLGGILAGSALLHGTGIALGRWLATRPQLLRGIGVATTLVGVVLIAG